ncbi:hypothetical protein EDC94DRAFT_697657 [Helicostylum pulchrum]|nr:hypothetical protein EDC94DRAFT_697657 [Helicostylum pulchrum]
MSQEAQDKSTTPFNRDLDASDLPMRWNSNTSLVDKLLLNDQKIIDLIVQVLLDTNIPNNSYTVFRGEWSEAENQIITYILQNEDEQFIPVVVAIQFVANLSSILKIVQHCTLIYEKSELVPAVLVIANKACPSLIESQAVYTDLNMPLTRIKSGFWAQECLLFLSDSNITPPFGRFTNAFIALCQFLSQPNKILNFSSDFENETIILLCKAIRER